MIIIIIMICAFTLAFIIYIICILEALSSIYEKLRGGEALSGSTSAISVQKLIRYASSQLANEILILLLNYFKIYKIRFCPFILHERYVL